MCAWQGENAWPNLFEACRSLRDPLVSSFFPATLQPSLSPLLIHPFVMPDKNLFMGTAGDWRGIIMSGPNGSAASSPQWKGKDGGFPGLWAKYIPLLGRWSNICSHCGLGRIDLSSHSNHGDYYVTGSPVTSQCGANIPLFGTYRQRLLKAFRQEGGKVQ